MQETLNSLSVASLIKIGTFHCHLCQPQYTPIPLNHNIDEIPSRAQPQESAGPGNAGLRKGVLHVPLVQLASRSLARGASWHHGKPWEAMGTTEDGAIMLMESMSGLGALTAISDQRTSLKEAGDR